MEKKAVVRLRKPYIKSEHPSHGLVTVRMVHSMLLCSPNMTLERNGIAWLQEQASSQSGFRDPSLQIF